MRSIWLMSVWVALGVALAGCYECTQENCADGCCSSEGVCIVKPTGDDACGLGGLACRDCFREGKSCIDSTCQWRSCNSTTCPSGCCTSTGQCTGYASQSTAACGTGANLCAACGNGQRCDRGACCSGAGLPCTDSYGCCSGFTCIDSASGKVCR